MKNTHHYYTDYHLFLYYALLLHIIIGAMPMVTDNNILWANYYRLFTGNYGASSYDVLAAIMLQHMAVITCSIVIGWTLQAVHVVWRSKNLRRDGSQTKDVW